MRIHHLAFLLLFQSFAACQQDTKNAQAVAEANLGFSSLTIASKALPSAKNIVFQSSDGGKTWQDASAGLPEGLGVDGIFSINNEVFVGTEKGLYHRISSTTPGWEKEILLEEHITDVASGRGGMYAGSYGNGIFQKMPGIPIWENLSYNLSDKTLRTILEGPDGSILVGTDLGIYKSANNGQTWKQVFADGIVLNLVASGNILIAGGRKGVVRSTDGGEHWDYVLNENILAKKTGLIGDQFVTILGTEDATKVDPKGITSRLRASDDGGKTWNRLEPALGPIDGAYDMDERLAETKDIYDIVQAGNQLFCSFDTGIFRSADQGKTWELVLPSKEKMTFRLAVSGGVVYAIPASSGC